MNHSRWHSVFTNFHFNGNTKVCGTLKVQDALKVCSVVSSSDPTRGALQVAGGVGIEKTLHVGQKAQVHSQLESNDIYTGSLVTAGGLGVGKRLNVGGQTRLTDASQSTSPSDGSLVVSGGVGISKSLNVAEDVSAGGRVYQAGHLLVPVGALVPYAGLVAPPGGYLLCDGSAISRTTYFDLFMALGDTFGAGDGSTTFNLPDMRGRLPMGVSGAHGLASNAGSESVTLVSDNMPAHAHTGTTASDGAHSHSVTDPGHSHTSRIGFDDGNISNIPGQAPPGDAAADALGASTTAATTGISVNSAGAHTHTFTTDSVGMASAFSVLNPIVALNYIIKH